MIRQALGQGTVGALQTLGGGGPAAGGNLGALILFRHYTVIFIPTIKNNNDSQLCNYLSFIGIARVALGSGGRG